MKSFSLLIAWAFIAMAPTKLEAQCAMPEFSLAPATDSGLPPTQSVAVGDSPNEVAIGFFNEDAFPDFATAESAGRTVSVRLGDGDGTFTAAPTIDFAANTPRSIVAGDFNGDGNDDLMMVTLEGRVFFVAGEGDGTFDSPETVATLGTTNNTRMIAGMLDEDTHLDIAISLEERDQVVVLFGDGDGDFSESDVLLINDPIGLTAGRLSGTDTDFDLAVVSREDRTVTIFEGNSRDFDEGNTYSISSSSEIRSSGITSGDVDGDGDDDLVALNRRNGTTGSDENAVVLFGANNGNFTVGPAYDVGFGPNQVEMADLNRDGLLDLAVSSSRIFQGSVVLGDGMGGFGPRSGFSAGGNPLDIAIADLDADGAPDFVVVNQPSDTVTVYLNTCNCLPSNLAPVVSGATATAKQGSPAQSFQVATATDPDGPVDALTARVLEPTTFAVSGIVNTGGVFTANVAAACTTPTGMNDVFIEISDGCRTTTATLQVDVTANTPPIAPDSASTTVPFGTNFSEFLTPLPSDNGTFTPQLAITPGTFTGTGGYDPQTGEVTINNAGPVGSYIADLTLTDQCGLETRAAYGLEVVPATTEISVTGPQRTRVGTPTLYSFDLAVSAPGGGTPTGMVSLSSGGTSCQVSVPTATNSCELNFDLLGPRTISATFESTDGSHLIATSSGVSDAQTLVFAEADLLVRKTDMVDRFVEGDLLVYTITLENLGPDFAQDLRLRDQIPAGLVDVTWTCDSSGGVNCPVSSGSGDIDAQIPSHPAGAVLTYTLSGNVAGDLPQIQNIATVELPPDEIIEDSDTFNNSASDLNLGSLVFVDGFEAVAIGAETGSFSLPNAALLNELDEKAIVVIQLDDAYGEATRIYARSFDGQLQFALAQRDDNSLLTLGPWVRYEVAPVVNWRASEEVQGWVVQSVHLE